jgi:hypothetical protein
LRALQEKIVYKVGDNRGEPVDIRVVAATNKVLEDEVKRGTFRDDLYYRLNVVTLKLPPLRDRGDDLVALGKFFLQKYAKEFGSKSRGFTPAATIAMKKYSWPGNIRELENRLKKAVVLADKALLGPDDLDLRPEDPTAGHIRGGRGRFRHRHVSGCHTVSLVTPMSPRCQTDVSLKGRPRSRSVVAEGGLKAQSAERYGPSGAIRSTAALSRANRRSGGRQRPKRKPSTPPERTGGAAPQQPIRRKEHIMFVNNSRMKRIGKVMDFGNAFRPRFSAESAGERKFELFADATAALADLSAT